MNTTYPASEKQLAFVTRLLGERNTTGTPFEGHTTAPALTKQQASEAITALLALPKDEQTSTEQAEAAPGFYFRGEQAFKVQQNKAKDHTYALVWSGSSWEYQPGAGRSLAGLVPMTAEQAAALGLASGRCINCLRVLGGETLSAKVSAVVGYGETCANHNGWFYPTGAKAQRLYLEEKDPEAFAELVAADKARKEAAANERACTPGQTCKGLSLCSKHSMEYQREFGRAYNE